MIDFRATHALRRAEEYLKINPKHALSGMLRELVAALKRYDKKDKEKSRRIAKLAHRIDKIALEWA